MKKMLATILALMIALSLAAVAGCVPGAETTGNQTDSTNTQTDMTAANGGGQEEADVKEYKGPVTDYWGKTCTQLLEEGEHPLVASTYPVLQDEYLVWLSDTLNELLEADGFTTMAMSAEGNIETQITQVENFITMGAVAIVEAAMDIESLASCNEKAIEAGVIVTNLGMQPTNHDICGGIRTNWTEIGTAAGEQVIAYLDAVYPDAGPGTFKAAFSQNSSLSRDVLQGNAMRAVIDQDPRIDIVYEKDLVQEIETGFNFAEEALTYDPEITLFVMNIDAAAVGANLYLASLPNVDYSKYAIFCTCGGETLQELLELSATNESAVRGSIFYGGDDPSYYLYDTAVKMLMGEEDIPYWFDESVWAVNSYGWTYDNH